MTTEGETRNKASVVTANSHKKQTREKFEIKQENRSANEKQTV